MSNKAHQVVGSILDPGGLPLCCPEHPTCDARFISGSDAFKKVMLDTCDVRDHGGQRWK